VNDVTVNEPVQLLNASAAGSRSALILRYQSMWTLPSFSMTGYTVKFVNKKIGDIFYDFILFIYPGH